MTVNVPELVAVPPGVVIAIFPVFAPVGTSTVTCEEELTVKVVAFIPPKVTAVVCVSPVPLMTTFIPTGPLVGLKLEMTGRTLKFLLLTQASPRGSVMSPDVGFSSRGSPDRDLASYGRNQTG